MRPYLKLHLDSAVSPPIALLRICAQIVTFKHIPSPNRYHCMLFRSIQVGITNVATSVLMKGLLCMPLIVHRYGTKESRALRALRT